MWPTRLCILTVLFFCLAACGGAQRRAVIDQQGLEIENQAQRIQLLQEQVSALNQENRRLRSHLTEQVDALREENQRLRSNLAESEQNLSLLRTRLNLLETTPVAECLARLDSLEVSTRQQNVIRDQLREQTAQTYYYRGMVDLFSNLEVRGVPATQTRLLVLNDYSYTFQVRLKDKILFEQTVATDGAQSPVQRVLENVATLRSLGQLIAFPGLF